MASFEVRHAALTEDERMVNPKFGPNENIDADHEGENHRDKECGVNEQERVPTREIVSG